MATIGEKYHSGDYLRSSTSNPKNHQRTGKTLSICVLYRRFIQDQIEGNSLRIYCQSGYEVLQLSQVAIQGTCHAELTDLNRDIHAVMCWLSLLVKRKI